MPFPESLLKRIAGKPTDASGGAEQTTTAQSDFRVRLGNCAIDDHLDLQGKRAIDCAFAITKVYGAGGANPQFLEHAVILAEPGAESKPEAEVLVVYWGDCYILGLDGVLPGRKEHIRITNLLLQTQAIIGDLAVHDNQGNFLRTVQRYVRIGKAADETGKDTILVITAKKDGSVEPHVVSVWGKIGDLFKDGKLNLSSTPESTAKPAEAVAPEKLDQMEIGKKNNSNKGVVSTGINPTDHDLWAHAMAIRLLAEPFHSWQPVWKRNLTPQEQVKKEVVAIPQPPEPAKAVTKKLDWAKIKPARFIGGGEEHKRADQSGNLRDTPEDIKARFAQQDLSPRATVKPREIPLEPIRMPKTGGLSSTVQESGRPRFKSSVERHIAHNERLKAKQKAHQGKGGGKKRH